MVSFICPDFSRENLFMFLINPEKPEKQLINNKFSLLQVIYKNRDLILNITINRSFKKSVFLL